MMTDVTNELRLVRPGLLSLKPFHLLGTACQACGVRSFPSRDFCPACDDDDVAVGVPLASSGRVYSFTVVRQAPPGQATPYNLALVDLDDDVRVMARLESGDEQPSIGMRVRLVPRPVSGADATTVMAFAFVPEYEAVFGKESFS